MASGDDSGGARTLPSTRFGGRQQTLATAAVAVAPSPPPNPAGVEAAVAAAPSPPPGPVGGEAAAASSDGGGSARTLSST